MKKLCLTYFLLLAVCFAFGQSNFQLQELEERSRIKKSKIKTSKTYLTTDEFSSPDEWILQSVISYEPDGKISKMVFYQNGDSVIYTYTYNDNNWVAKKTIQCPPNACEEWQYEYDNNHRIIKQLGITDTKELHKFVYQDDFYLSARESFVSVNGYDDTSNIHNWKSKSLNSYQYDDNGRLVKDLFLLNGNLVIEEHLNYTGKLHTNSIIYKYGMRKYIVDYIYDKKGNRLEERRFDNLSEETTYIKYEYEYYNKR